MRPSLWLTALAGSIGCVAGAVAAQGLRSAFLGLAPIDFTLVAPAGLLIAAVVAAAAWFPARRAAAIEPAAALKES